MLILASASPRRQDLLRNAGIEFLVQPANVAEELVAGETPEDCVERLARSKARAVFSRRTLAQSDYAVLGADTIVVVDDHILGKPLDTNDAARMLRLLAGREHRVITGVCLIPPSSGNECVRHEVTRVTMGDLSETDLMEYLAQGESMDKAGAYAIQGRASRWIPKIEGCYFNVVGLPVALVETMLRKCKQEAVARRDGI
jgi:septum formation protein